MLVAAMNPCPCGYANVPERKCLCPHNRVRDYQLRISGPLLDRIDITLHTRPVGYLELAQTNQERPSCYYRSRVEEARERQRRRFQNEKDVFCNSQMGPRQLSQYCVRTDKAEKVLQEVVRQFSLSARAHDRVLKLARTRADLEGHDQIEDSDMLLAVECRKLDREGWKLGDLPTHESSALGGIKQHGRRLAQNHPPQVNDCHSPMPVVPADKDDPF
jgi:magnesium chelatase family protein